MRITYLLTIALFATTGFAIDKDNSTEEIVQSYSKLAGLIETISDDTTLTLFEGLPHQGWEPTLLQSELKNKKTIERFGFDFYKSPNPVSASDLATLKTITTEKNAFVKFSGFKACGGFHPDFSLVWKNAGEEKELEIHLCFGCGEIKAYQGDVVVHCDISPATEKAFKTLLQKHYQKQRPAKEVG